MTCLRLPSPSPIYHLPVSSPLVPLTHLYHNYDKQSQRASSVYDKSHRLSYPSNNNNTSTPSRCLSPEGKPSIFSQSSRIAAERNDHRTQSEITDQSRSDIIKIIFAIILPPVGVFLERGCGADFLINVLLTILGYIPGVSYNILRCRPPARPQTNTDIFVSRSFTPSTSF